MGHHSVQPKNINQFLFGLPQPEALESLAGKPGRSAPVGLLPNGGKQL